MMDRNRYSRVSTIVGLIVLGVLVIGFLLLRLWDDHAFRHKVEKFAGTNLDKRKHIYDYAGIIPATDTWCNSIPNTEHFLQLLQDETDIDLRIVLLKDTGGKSIEEVSLEKVQAFRIGGNTREERGVLLLFDLDGKRLRVEVGYGLEGYFSDAFVSYLINDHAPVFMSSRNPLTGMVLLVRMLHYRIRQAKLGNDFDSSVLKVSRRQGHLSGGAGSSAAMPESPQGDIFRLATKEEHEYYLPQPTPGEVYQKYLDWLQAGHFVPGVDMFTKETQEFLATLPMSKAYFHFHLLRHYGKQFKIDSRGTVAMLYYTDDPLAPPLFFAKRGNWWQLDIAGAILTTVPYYGTGYSWGFSGLKDIYTITFGDKLVKTRGVLRVADGANRAFPIRGSTSYFTEAAPISISERNLDVVRKCIWGKWEKSGVRLD